MDHIRFDELGYKAFPLPFGQKAPPPTGWQRLAGRVRIPEHANVGLSTENFSVADIDAKALIERFEKRFRERITTVVATPRDGRHYYFSGEATNQQNDGWDVRGRGGYVVAPGSEVDGKPYRLLTPLEHVSRLKPFPDELRKEPRKGTEQVLTNEPFRRITRAKAYAAKVVCIEHAQAQNTLFRLCCFMRHIGLTKTEAFAVLLDWNRTNCFREDGLTPYPWSQRELVHKLDDAFSSP